MSWGVRASVASTAAVILAAGQGTRMKSERLKVLHEVCGRPMVDYVIETAREATRTKPFVVVGYQAEAVKEATGDKVTYVTQEVQNGTGHAVMQAVPFLSGRYDEVVVLYGDCPLLPAATLSALIENRRDAQAACAVLTFRLPDPSGYGRVLRAGGNRIAKIVEQRDATLDELSVNEVNSGIYCFDASALLDALPLLRDDNAQKEFYITDVLSILHEKGLLCIACEAANPEECLGINDRCALAEVSEIVRKRILDDLMLSGVTIDDPASTFADAEVVVGPDTRIMPHTFLKGKTHIGKGCLIGPQTLVDESVIGDDVTISFSVIEKSRVCDRAKIGPFSHLRPASVIGEDAEIGNYAEIKNSSIGKGSKIHHHSYVGDSTLGERVNFSAGAITVNYDGRVKHHTDIADGAFVGCNVNLIAPVKVGKDAFVAAGSTVTDEVPPEALAIARERQTNKEGWVTKKRKQAMEAKNTTQT